MLLRAPIKQTNSQTYSGYLYAQYIGTFKGPYIQYRCGKYVQKSLTVAVLIVSTVELHLSGLIGTERLLDMQKIWINGFFIENRLHWRFGVEMNFYKQLF